MPLSPRTPKRGRVGRAELPLLVLTIAGVTAVAIMGLVMLLRLQTVGVEHERREAVREARLLGTGIVAPVVSRAALEGGAQLARLDRVVRERVLKEPVVRIKLWTADGRIVYSDEARLIGRRFPLGPEERALVTTGGSTSSLSDLSKPENRFERDKGQLLEVYTPIKGPDGTELLFEAYQRFESIAANDRDLWVALLPALVGGLLLLELINLGVARWFAGYIRRQEQQRVALLAQALDATSTERRRIAADLHDGLVQDLTAASVTVAATTRALRHGGVGERSISALENAGEAMRQGVGTLRTLLIDFYPADLAERGFSSALGDLVALAGTRGLDVRLDVAPGMRAELGAEGLLYRVAQEALRNVTAHAHASHAFVSAGIDNSGAWVEVRDDGQGFDPQKTPASGHIGLRALRNLVTDANGELTVQSRPGEGTVVRAQVPPSP
jgi:two-component system NarL family sensor kinase